MTIDNIENQHIHGTNAKYFI